MRTAALLAVAAGSVLMGTVARGSAAPPSSPRPASPAAARTAAASALTPLTTANAQLVSLAAASFERGDGLFYTSRGARCEAVAARTANGGVQFVTPVAITAWNCSGTAAVDSLAADAAGDEFAYGPLLFIDRNGLGKWLASPQPGVVLAISADGSSVWMLLGEPDRSSCRLVLMDSANDGGSWQPVPSQPDGAIIGGGCANESAGGQTWLVRTGPASGYVLARPPVNDVGRPNSAGLWYTSNAGVSWSARRIPCGLDAISVAMSVAPDGALAAVCAYQPTAGSQPKSTALSADGGRRWTVLVGCQFFAPCGHPSPLIDGYLGQIEAVSARVIYLVGPRSSLLVTTDGGRRWRLVRPLIGAEGNGTSQVIFFGQSDGLVFGNTGSPSQPTAVWRTDNAGRTWIESVVSLVG